jgi:hypothetical protein
MSIRRSPVAVVRTVALILAASLVAGCGGGDAQAPTAPAAAKEFLVQALDAWKAGQPRDSLSKGTPSIMVNDQDWERKAKLTDYKLEGDGESMGAGVKWTVPLTLSIKGKTVERKAVYGVYTADATVSISRLDLDL